MLNTLNRGHEYRRILITGDGGTGKSTFCKYIARYFSGDGTGSIPVFKQKNDKWNLSNVRVTPNWCPIFLRLRDLETELEKYNRKDWKDNFTLERFFSTRYNETYETPAFYNKLFKHLPCLFLIDGIDEVAEFKDFETFIIRRMDVLHWLNARTAQLGDLNPKSAFVLTSRPFDSAALTRDFALHRVQAFEKHEITCFAEQWYTAFEKTLEQLIVCTPEPSRKAYYQSKLENLPDNKSRFLNDLENPHVIELIENPLLLSLAILIHSVDEGFAIGSVEKLYEAFIKTLLYQWDDVRQMNFFPKLLGDRNLENLEKLIRRLAFYFSSKETAKMKVRDFLPFMEQSVERFKSTLPEPERINELCVQLLHVFRDRSGLFTGSKISEEDFLETEFEFPHKTFQDYLTALSIAEDDLLQNGEISLSDKVGSSFWDRTIEFYVNLKNPDYFFKKHIEVLQPDSSYIDTIHYFTQYFLLAKDKNAGIEDQLVEKYWDILTKSDNPKSIHKAALCLSKLEMDFDSKLLKYLEIPTFTYTEAFKKGMILQLFTIKGEYPAIRKIILNYLENIEYEEIDVLKELLFVLSYLVIVQKDFTLLKARLSVIYKNDLNTKITRLIHLLDLIELQELQKLREFMDLREMQKLLEFRKLRNLHSVYRLYGKARFYVGLDLREYRKYRIVGLNRGEWDFLEFTDLRGVQNQLFEEYIKVYAIIPHEIEEICKKVLAILENLTEEQKRKYFDYWDEPQ
ncbi:MAG TPA: hypothetical protein PKC40_03595 [Saprospiraceae bacterium]|nr:hypothetical protein [Saprospiraceae bacterium]